MNLCQNEDRSFFWRANWLIHRQTRETQAQSARTETRVGVKRLRVPYIHRQIATFDILSEEGLCLIEQNADTILRDIGMEFHNDA